MGPRLSDLVPAQLQNGTYTLPMYRDEHQNQIQPSSPVITKTEGNSNKKATLDLSMTELTKLPSNMLTKRRGGSLRVLKLNSNYLRTLSHDISNLKNLRELHVQYNQQEYIHPSVWTLPKLELLDLSFNSIATIPAEIHCLGKTMTKLYLSYNSIYKLPDQFGLLYELVELDLSSNKFNHIPQAILNLNRNLRRLNLENNNISYISKDVSKLKGLRELNLLRNPINTIHQKAMDYLLGLEIFRFGTENTNRNNVLTNPSGGVGRQRLKLPTIPRYDSSHHSGSLT